MSAGNEVYQSPRLIPVSVKTLAEFAAKSGSLDRRFTPSPTAQEGIAGHQEVVLRRPPHYQKEMSLTIQYEGLLIRGRADGYDSEAHCLEEIKTFYGDFEKLPDNHRQLHWAQARLYGWMYCRQYQRNDITLALIYFDLHNQREYRVEEHFTLPELVAYGEDLAEVYWQWQQQINARQQQLSQWIDELAFPYGSFRSAQRQMAESVYKAAATGRVLLAEAPTGTGKTLASIFPAIKAFNKTPVDKIFYLTAKTTGKQLALENLQLIASDGIDTPLRVLELTAQEKICLEPDKRCTGDSCPFARNFYDKLQQARQAAYTTPLLTRQTLTQLAHTHEICPYYLGMEMSRWVDILVADFNYYFDTSALLQGLTRELNWHPYLLVDECHNLVERARQMYSAELDRSVLLAAKRLAPKPIKTSLERVNRLWLATIKTLDFSETALTLLNASPEKLNLALTGFTNDYIDFLQRHPDHPVQHTAVQDFFFAALNYLEKLELVDEDYCIDMQRPQPKQEVLTLRNLIPARPLAARLAQAHSACFFSATLRPAYFYQQMLGLPDDTVYLQVPSPFASQQLQVKVARHISTRYRDRSTAIGPLCDIIEQQVTAATGNYLAFFSSYEFLQQVERELQQRLSSANITVITQSRRMSEQDREAFIERFTHEQNLLGLAVLGGAFSEGVDLPGDALKGAFIATLGLPQINPVTEHLRQRLQQVFQQGYHFAYLYPGIQKVVQAAGRVIRTQEDTGYLWLLDDRFAQHEVRQLLPEWWEISR
ncbi:MAG: ATP-dependent DNA helicase [Cellvibrio sp.]